MKYVIRAIKYFFYFAILCSAIIGALVLIGAVESDINAIFDDGYASVIKIVAFFALVASVYPKFGFITRQIAVNAEWADIREVVVQYMAEKRYVIEEEGHEKVTFRIKGFAAKLTKMYEDRITLTKTENGWAIEGLRKDAFRIANGLEHRLSSESEQ
jgi:hypothetical protein